MLQHGQVVASEYLLPSAPFPKEVEQTTVLGLRHDEMICVDESDATFVLVLREVVSDPVKSFLQLLVIVVGVK